MPKKSNSNSMKTKAHSTNVAPAWPRLLDDLFLLAFDVMLVRIFTARPRRAERRFCLRQGDSRQRQKSYRPGNIPEDSKRFPTKH
jgi:hypothetical protein